MMPTSRDENQSDKKATQSIQTFNRPKSDFAEWRTAHTHIVLLRHFPRLFSQLPSTCERILAQVSSVKLSSCLGTIRSKQTATSPDGHLSCLRCVHLEWAPTTTAPCDFHQETTSKCKGRVELCLARACLHVPCDTLAHVILNN